MKRTVLPGALLTLLAVAAAADGIGEMSLPTAPKRDVKQTEIVALWLKEIQTIKVGMTRQHLLEVFTTEGGLSSRTWRTYVYRKCQYIKVDVEFKPVGNEADKFAEMPEDLITKISRPYLQWPIMD